MVIVLSILRPNFLSLQNGLDLLSSYAFNGMLVSGLLVVLIAGGIDISFAAVASVAQFVALTAANATGIGWIGVVAIAGGIGLCLGLVNGVLVSTLGIASIIVTIATQSVIYGILLTVTKGQDIFSLPDWFTSGVSIPIHTDAEGNEYAISLQIIALAASFAVAWFLLNRTTFGRQIYALGGNPEAARRGRFRRVSAEPHGLCVYGSDRGARLACASPIHPIRVADRAGRARTRRGGGGGPRRCEPRWGRRDSIGCLLGLALIAVMQNGLALLGVSSYWS